MTGLTRTFVMANICLFWLLATGGCGNGANDAYARLFPNALGASALRTHACYVKLRNAGEISPSDDVPRSCWAKEIRALRPLRVYLHRSNVVVVRNVSDGVEEGKYINIIIASFLPRNGEDGFTFTSQDGCVYDFRRSVHD